MEPTSEQKQWLEEFSQKRDSLSLEVGILTTEHESLTKDNRSLSSANAALTESIKTMQENAAKLGFAESEKLAALRIEVAQLEEKVKSLTSESTVLSKDISDRNNTLLALGALVNAIKTVTEDTSGRIQQMGNDLNVYTNSVKLTSDTIHLEADRVKSFVNDLDTVVDRERKDNYERNRVLDNRELALINREKLVEMKYKELSQK